MLQEQSTSFAIDFFLQSLILRRLYKDAIADSNMCQCELCPGDSAKWICILSGRLRLF